MADLGFGPLLLIKAFPVSMSGRWVGGVDISLLAFALIEADVWLCIFVLRSLQELFMRFRHTVQEVTTHAVLLLLPSFPPTCHTHSYSHSQCHSISHSFYTAQAAGAPSLPTFSPRSPLLRHCC